MNNNIILLFLVYLTIIILYMNTNVIINNFTNLDKKCICLLTYKPHKIWLDFLNDFSEYDIYVIIDDNTINYNNLYNNKYPNISFIQMDNDTCLKSGFIDLNFTIHKKITSWEKGLYYFSNINTTYKNVWFIEDDVYFYNQDTILNIDKQYPDSDFLSNKYGVNNDNDFLSNEWHWNQLDIKFDLPYYNAMVCACRMSQKLLQKIKIYATDHNTLFFLEALFPTITMKYNLIYDTPNELSTIEYRYNFMPHELNKTNLFHPIKDMDKHFIYKTN